jgi:Asp/Glu/hydantoin racemase
MKWLVLNPNRTAAMTASVAAEVRRLLDLQGRRDISVCAATCASGPPVICSEDSYQAGARSLSTEGAACVDGHTDAVLLACFGDPGLAALQARIRPPVAGMATAALDAARQAGQRFHIVTAGAAWDGLLRQLVAAHGSADLLDGITLLPSNGLAASRDAAGTLRRLQTVLDGLARRGAPRCILGGAGFAGLRPQLAYPGVLTDGIEAATLQLLAARTPGRALNGPCGSAR